MRMEANVRHFNFNTVTNRMKCTAYNAPCQQGIYSLIFGEADTAANNDFVIEYPIMKGLVSSPKPFCDPVEYANVVIAGSSYLTKNYRRR